MDQGFRLERKGQFDSAGNSGTEVPRQYSSTEWKVI
jgi:hypothetical protein